MAKQQKLEPEFEEVLEPSQLSGHSPKVKVHCVVTTVSRRARIIVASTARSLVGRHPCVTSVAKRLLLLSSSLTICMPNVRQKVHSVRAPGNLPTT